MKKSLLVFSVLLFAFFAKVSAVNITIIESHNSDKYTTMDTLWNREAHSMGYNSVIDSQSVLNDTTFFATTDILIVSSAIDTLTDTQLQTIIKFIKGGKPAYIQAEWSATLPGDITFQAVMDSLGTNFRWIGDWENEINTMLILGSFATTPYQTDTIHYFYWGQRGTGSDVDSFLLYNGGYYGFFYHKTDHNYGAVITTSDEDWINQDYDTLLMKNILYHLVISDPTVITTITNNDDLVSIYPNPNNGAFYMETPELTDAKWNLYDLLGRQLSTGQLSISKKSQFDFSYLPDGNYILNIHSPQLTINKKITIAK